MPTGTVHAIENKHIYIRTPKTSLNKNQEVNHVFLDHGSRHHIVPLRQLKTHSDLLVGDKVEFMVSKDSRVAFRKSLHYSIPAFTGVLGFSIASALSTGVFGGVAVVLLSSSCGIMVQRLFFNQLKPHKEVDVKIASLARG